MNSLILQDKVREIKEEAEEMRLLKKSDELECQAHGEALTTVTKSYSTVSLKHYDQLLCDLRCPGCTKPLQPPIYLCFSGHSLCTICRLALKICPICREQVSDIRSKTLERLSGKFQFPCKNLRNGCMVRLPMELMKWHEDKCSFRKTSCFMGKVWHDCDWIGRESEWMAHCESKHPQKILKNKEKFELIWNYETLKDNCGPIISYYLIQTFSETFNLYQIHEAKHKLLTWTAILANYKETDDKKRNAELPKYSFELEFYQKKDERHLLVQRYPIHYEDSEVILDDGMCIKVKLCDIERFLDDEKNLFYRVRIISCKSKDRWEDTMKYRDMQQNSSEYDNFSFFDSTSQDKVFINDEFCVVVSERQKIQQRNGDDDMLKQIFDKEFKGSPIPEATKFIQKPPRKSLENINQRNSGNLSSRSSFNFGD